MRAFRGLVLVVAAGSGACGYNHHKGDASGLGIGDSRPETTGSTGGAGEFDAGQLVESGGGRTGVPAGTGGVVATTPDAARDLPTDVPAETGGMSSTGGIPNTGGTVSDGGIVTAGGALSTGGLTNTGGSTNPPVTGGNAGHYQMENLDRGLVAVKVTGGVYIGWRMFGYEYDTTATNVSYNLYKDGTSLVTVNDSTNFVDATGTSSSAYSVAVVINGIEGTRSSAVSPWTQQYLSIPLQIPPNGPNGGAYSPNDASPGDLDGDGQLDIVLKWDPSNSKDSSISGVSDSVLIDGIKMDGTQLWRIDVGMNIRAGAHDTQFSVYDFDGDGKAEVAFKTAPGTKDGKGNFLKTGPAAGADNTIDYRSAKGMALGGPEWLTVFSGATGEELATVEYPVLYGSRDWGDPNGNRSHRYNGGFAFVKDGGVATGLPSIIQQRGYYTQLTMSALTFRDGVLAKNWVYDSITAIPNGGGDHSCMAADVDGDLGQEIIPGARTINSDGTFKCDSGMGHGDAMDVGELVPGKGITVFSIHEALGGMDAHDGATCAFYFAITNVGDDTSRGRAEYVGAGDEASASCTSLGSGPFLCADGLTTAPSAGSNFVIYWDADEWRELENGWSITKAGGGTLLSCSECASNSSTKSTPTLIADLLGDWREEIVWRETSNAALRVYTTTEVTKRRIYTLMHDPTYRAQVSFEQSGYNQPPHTGFRISPNMDPPPKPNIYVR
jgi:hypothetical protein